MLSLNNVLLANAMSCLIFGLIFVAFPQITANFLGADNPAPSLLFTILGGALVFHALHLIWISKQDRPSVFWVVYFSLGDTLWVFGTLILVSTELWITSEDGVYAAFIVATMVGILGALQVNSLRALR